ncbi:hypothetical protein REC12_22530 [Desulfosporosinus sp. PR]|uniref:hypothetical protein n=1 Tax=Candidatus Desulfosporosinus nitrosoreducens TaxID=3401928 RepID=UPI0027FBE912|nr:hypothetical protein [Desulfosporosinus sp. PR]MDQ7096375.1 hypothetical protein [Desulfosporosinus sp. PR]
MSVFIKFQKISDTDGIVTYQNFVPDDPFHGVSQDQRSTGIMVDSVPEPTPQTNKGQELHINPQTLVLTWVYPDITIDQMTADQKIAQLQSDLATANESMAELTIMLSSLLTPTT